MEQAKAACRYTAKYVAKEGDLPTYCLTVLSMVNCHGQRFPSVAEDTGTDERTAAHVLTRSVNYTTGTAEYAGQTPALACLRFPANLYTHSFEYLFIRPAMHSAKSAMADSGVSQAHPSPPAHSDSEDGSGATSSVSRLPATSSGANAMQIDAPPEPQQGSDSSGRTMVPSHSIANAC